MPAYQRGFRIVFIIGASLAALAFFLAMALMPQVELNRADDARLKEEGKRRFLERRSRKSSKSGKNGGEEEA